ncbi:MAG: sugar ABC transporter permease [Chloroflexi bacterium]|nr:sugar ABC transporter permease [Chloroflexota bacterium]
MADTAQTVPPVQPNSPARARAKSWRRTDWFAYIYLAPALIILTIFHIIPVIYALWISMQFGTVRNFRLACADADAIAKIPEAFGILRNFLACFDNYNRALNAPEFWDAMKTTLFYVLGTVPPTIFLGIVVAYLLFQKIRGRGVYRTIYFMPHVISTVASAIVWAWVFDPRNGLANHFMQFIGLPVQQWLVEPDGVFKLMGESLKIEVPEWAEGPSLALVSIMIFSFWQSLGFDVIIFLAGLTNINAELYEAGRIDGANGAQLFRHITLPLLAPTLFFVLVISVIGSFQAFNHIFAMNRMVAQPLGGPIGATRTVSVLMFNTLYAQQRAGYATAIAVLLSLVILALTLIQFKYLGRRGEGA